MEAGNSNETRVETQGIQEGRSIDKKTHWKRLPYSDWTSCLTSPASFRGGEGDSVLWSTPFTVPVWAPLWLPSWVYPAAAFRASSHLSFPLHTLIPHFCTGLTISYSF